MEERDEDLLSHRTTTNDPLMTVEERFRIVRSVGGNCINDQELITLLANNPRPIFYDAFEPSGPVHISQGIIKTMNVNKLISAGCRVKILIKDWCELGEDANKIEAAAQSKIEIWKALGMDPAVEFLSSSAEINSRAHEYWPLVMDIATVNDACRMERCAEPMGHRNKDTSTGGQILDQCFNCADILFFQADVWLLEMDHQDVAVLAREFCDINRKKKPIILCHHMLPGLMQGQQKMSKNDPSSSIFMEDNEEDVNRKITSAYCPPNVVDGNPCMEYVKYLILPWFNEFKVERSADQGGDKTFISFEDLAADYECGELDHKYLKPALSKSINAILQPVRDHLKKNASVCKDLGSNNDSQMTAGENFRRENWMPLGEKFSRENGMTVEEKFRIVRSVGEECIKDQELLTLLANCNQPISYDGFEPSGRMHIAQGIMKTINVNKLISAGCRVKILIADWFAFLNNKMGKDRTKIEAAGRYMIEVWKALGMDPGVEFLWSSAEINSRAQEYWPLVKDIANRNSRSRLTRCAQIMGRKDKDTLTVGQILYTCMQCADIFFLQANICQLGMDQRKVNVLAREYCRAIKRKDKPVIISHHMLPGLLQGQAKMSKSDPSSSIFMEDNEEDVNRKITSAYCPPNVVEGNPCLEYIKYLIFPWFNEFKVERNADQGGDKAFSRFEDLAADYECGELDPKYLKPALSKSINSILQPVRDHFRNNESAKELLDLMKG